MEKVFEQFEKGNLEGMFRELDKVERKEKRIKKIKNFFKKVLTK